ncbi:MAG: Holliday junction branch migration protein RuvA [Synechococcus sp.]|nr:Holliday junction branch migration protein RuvA [Synechococcus sp.]
MIGWLQGERVDSWSQGGRQGLVIACGGVGYEVQLTSGHRRQLEAETVCTAWIHQVQRDDGSTLYGFLNKGERDLFRTLISVNGVGPQMALALLECCGAEALVNAIVDGDLRQLTQAQGVGKRTAERLAVELRDRLGDWKQPAVDALSLVDRSDLQALPIQGDPLEELQQTLDALGYEDLEIRRAMRAVAQSDTPPSPGDGEAWLRESLRWLSRASA